MLLMNGPCIGLQINMKYVVNVLTIDVVLNRFFPLSVHFSKFCKNSYLFLYLKLKNIMRFVIACLRYLNILSRPEHLYILEPGKILSRLGVC